MNIKPIRTEKDYEDALAHIDAILEAQPGTLDGDLLEMLTFLLEAYEEQHPIVPPDPIEAIEFHVERLGLDCRDLEPYNGSRARVSEILNHRPMTLAMIRKLQARLVIPAVTLLQTYPLAGVNKAKVHTPTPTDIIAAHK